MPLPLVLAGPILRRVEPNLVSVWFALSRAASVVVTLWQGRIKAGAPDSLISSGPASGTLRVGERLHVVAAVLKIPAGSEKILQPGRNYSYDVEIIEAGGARHTLASLGLLKSAKTANGGDGAQPMDNLALGYDEDFLPSFSLPPEKLEELRIVYGSCRRPANGHLDAMPWIDDVIEKIFKEAQATQDAERNFALTRPHQLFLGGDQIYADDVSPVHLWAINRLAHMLLSDAAADGAPGPAARPIEVLELSHDRTKRAGKVGETVYRESVVLGYEAPNPERTEPARLPATLELFPPGGRLDLTQIEAAMSTVDGEAHLMSIGEFAAMYVMVWCNACWFDSLWPNTTQLVEGSLPNELPLLSRTITDEGFFGYLDGLRKDLKIDVNKRPERVAKVRAANAAENKKEREVLEHLKKSTRADVLEHLARRIGIAKLTKREAAIGLTRDNVKKLIDETKVEDWQLHLETCLREAGQGEFASWVATLIGEGEGRVHRCAAELTPKSVAGDLEAVAETELWPRYASLARQRKLLNRVGNGLPKVRRALANIPTYMIFDDHDVTDDWNLNPVWYDRVMTAPLGRQIVRNALITYALFQDWGNDPLRYEDEREDPGPKGDPKRMLDAIARLFPPDAPDGPEPAAVDTLDKLLGLNLRPQPNVDGGFESVDPPIKWHFSIGGPKHLAIALDNRTRRSFVSRQGPAGNVSVTAQAQQVPPAPLPAGKEVLIVVAPLQVLAPSLFDEIVAPAAYRAFDAIAGKAAPDLAEKRGFEFMVGTNPDAIESWALDALTFEALLARLAPYRQIVLLSGDVHYSAATQLSYWRKGESLPARFVQFTSSGIKNVMPEYIVQIDHSLAAAQALVRTDIGGDRMGWDDGAEDAIVYPPGKNEGDVPPVNRKRLRRKPALLPIYGWPAKRDVDPVIFSTVKADDKPDWSWRLRPVFDLRADKDRPPMAQPLDLSGAPPIDQQIATAGDPVLAYQRIAARHQQQLDRLQ